MSKQLTIKDFKSVAQSPDFLALSQAILSTRSEARRIRDIVDSYAVPIFRSLNFVRSPKMSGRKGLCTGGEPILDPKNVYLSDDEQLFEQFIKLVHAKHLEHGFQVEYGSCPALIADHEQVKAENALLNFMEKELGLPHWSTLEQRQKYIDLFLSVPSLPSSLRATAEVPSIVQLNDRLRKGDHTLGKTVGSAMFSNLNPDQKLALVRLVRAFDDFTPENDPYREHDFGSVEFEGDKWFFKIDYFDLAYEYGAEDPSDPAQTRRVMTIMHSSEY